MLKSAFRTGSWHHLRRPNQPTPLFDTFSSKENTLFRAFFSAPPSPTSLSPAPAAAPPGHKGALGVFPGHFSGGAIDSRGSEPLYRRFLLHPRAPPRRRAGGNTEDRHRHGAPKHAMADMGAHCCCGVPSKLRHRALGPQLVDAWAQWRPTPAFWYTSPLPVISPHAPLCRETVFPLVSSSMAPDPLGQKVSVR